MIFVLKLEYHKGIGWFVIPSDKELSPPDLLRIQEQIIDLVILHKHYWPCIDGCAASLDSQRPVSGWLVRSVYLATTDGPKVN
jgi:hypothetical protein